MQGLWYGDRRDRVKWGALIHLAKMRTTSNIIQVAYYRDEAKRTLETSERLVPLPAGVWEHFSTLRHIERLAEATGVRIVVFDDILNPTRRREYVAAVVLKLKDAQRPTIVFLDPDTGIEPVKADSVHVTKADLAEIWAALLPNDVLAAYQHADHTSSWQEDRTRKMVEACGGTRGAASGR
jgi:hypothetical protein